jgi:hypothetical protein
MIYFKHSVNIKSVLRRCFGKKVYKIMFYLNNIHRKYTKYFYLFIYLIHTIHIYFNNNVIMFF